jgi:hypothetical protein
MVKSVIYLLFSYQTGYIQTGYIDRVYNVTLYTLSDSAEGNIEHKPGMSHYIPCLIAPKGI